MKKNVPRNKVAIFVAEKETPATKKIKTEIKKLGFSCSVFSQENIFYTSNGIYYNNKKISLDNFSFAILRLAPFFSKKYKKRFDFENEISILLQNLSHCKVVNKKIYKKYPFYNKFSQIEIFNKNKIPSPFGFHTSINNKDNVLNQIRKAEMTFPVVAKISNSSQGTGVYKISSQKGLLKFLSENRGRNIVFQEYIENDGDYRILVVGKKSLGIMKRSGNSKQWKNNISLGALQTPYQNKKMEEFAVKICKKIGFDLAGVDILKRGNKFLVLEINDVPGFKGFEKTYPKINVAKELAKHLTGADS